MARASKKQLNNNLISQNNISDNLPRKRGRPVGSKNKTPSKIRKDTVQCVVSDEVRQKILSFNMILYKLPKLVDYNDIGEIDNRTDLFFTLCMQHSITPTVAAYSLSLGVDRHTLYNWLNGKSDRIKNQKCLHTLKTAYDFINSSYESLLTEGKIIPVSAFFLLQNNYGYKQQTDHVITAGNNENVTEEDITNRANLYD